MSINYATFSGSITRGSIHQGVSANGREWANFTIAATSSTYDKGTGTYKKEPNFYCECVVFGKLADTIAPVLKEGANLLVSGHFFTKGYTKDDGQSGIDYQLICDNVAVNCVPWQTIGVTVNNSPMSSTGSSQTVQSVPQTPVQAQQPIQQYSMSGAAALGIPDEPSF